MDTWYYLGLKALFLFVAIWFSLVNFYNYGHDTKLPKGNFIFQALGITGFIVLHWWI